MRTRRVRAAGVLAWTIAAVPAWAGGGETPGLSLWTFIFLGFGALIVAFQAVPAVVLFGAMLRGLFSRRAVPAETRREPSKGA